MDTFDSHRSTVPARLPALRPGSSALRTTTGLPETAVSPLSIRVALRGARRYWWLVLALWIVGSVGISAVIYMKVRPNYRAYSYLRVEPQKDNIFGGQTSGETLDAYLQTQVQLITSPNVLTAAGTSPKAAMLPRIQTAGDVVQELRKAISVNVVPGTYLIEVSMTSQSAFEAATLVNAAVDAFMASNSEWSDGMTRNQIKNLETYQVELKDQTDVLERRWKELAVLGDPDAEYVKNIQQQNSAASKAEDGAAVREGNVVKAGTVTIDEYKRVRHELFQVNLDLAQAQAWLDSARKAAKNASTQGQGAQVPNPTEEEARIAQQVVRRFRADPEVIQLATEIQGAKSKLDDVIRVAAQGNDPAERIARRKLDTLLSQYNQLWETKSRLYRETPAAGGKVLDPDQEILEASAKVEALKIKQATLKKASESLEITTRNHATTAVEISLVLDQRSSYKEMQEAVNRRLEQLRYESKGGARIRPVNTAVPPGRPISDKRMTYLAMTPVGVLGTVLGLIVLLEIRSARVADPDVLSSRVKHEVFSIAPLPNLRPGDDPNSDRAEQRLARFVQSLDHLRVAICEGGEAGSGRCVMITSATGGEGKTTLSAHLAARCANAGTSTLLIDADLRRASLGRLLDVPVGPGLSDVLGGEADLDGTLITVQAGGFHFLSAGTPGRDPSRVLKSARLSELIGRLRQTYDLVIIDTPPVLPVADALIMGRWADGAVMAARFDASRLPLVERANRQLALAGIPVLGVVVNGVRGQDATYGNYAYSYHYYPGASDRPTEPPTV